MEFGPAFTGWKRNETSAGPLEPSVDDQRVSITFLSKADLPGAELFWQQPGSGRLTTYGTLDPGSSRAFDTFHGHSWVARCIGLGGKEEALAGSPAPGKSQ